MSDRETLTLTENISVDEVFNSLVNKSKEIDLKCEDDTVSKVDSYINFSDGSLYYTPDDSSKLKSRAMSKFAFSQLCTKLGVPSRYIQKCFDAGMTSLVEENINSWLHEYDKPLFIRSYDDRIRGVLSSRYQVLDSHDIIDVTSQVMGDNCSIKSYFLNEEKLHIRATSRESFKINGDVMFPGIQIDSSDVGMKSLTVKYFLYRQVCTNGLCVSVGNALLFSQKHIGIDKDKFYAEFSNSMKNGFSIVDSEVRDMIQLSSKESVSSDKDGFIAMFNPYPFISKEAASSLFDLCRGVYNFSVWGLINSITQYSRDYSLDRRLMFESFAGDLLSGKIALKN